MAKKERLARSAKAEKSSFSKLHNKIKKKGKNKGMLPQPGKSQRKRVEQYGFDLTQASRPQLEKLSEDDLRAMSFVRGEGKQGNKQQLINGLLGFKLKIQERDVREHLYAQYLARCAKMYEQSAFAARGDVLKAIKLGGGAAMLKKSPTANSR